MEIIWIFVIIFHLLVFMIGLPGNLLILRVFIKKTRKTSTNVFIMALASADLMACLLRPFFVTYLIFILREGNIPIEVEITYFTLNFITVYSSTLLTAAIAFDRYDAVCRPHTRLLSYRGAQILAVCCFAISIPMTIPCVLLYFNSSLQVRLAKHCETLAAYIMALILVLVFYIRVYKAVLFRTKVRTQWGGRFTGITTAGENSISMTGHTEVSALQPSREFTKLSPVAETPVVPTGNHVTSTVQPPQDTPQGTMQVDMEIACVNEDKNSVTYRNLSSGGGNNCCALGGTDAYPGNPPPPYSQAMTLPNTQEQSSNLSVPRPAQVPASSSSSSGSFTERTGSTGRFRSPSEKGKSSKTVAARMQNKTTRMLLLTTICFFVTWVPYMCLSSMNIYMVVANRPLKGTSALNTASHMLYINNAANPFIYVLANRQFRNDCKREVRKLLQSCFRR